MAFTARTETYTDLNSLTTPYNFTVTKPTGTVDGDILFCWIAWYGAGLTIDSVPSGWTLLGQYILSTDKYALYYKIASGEGASWVWSLSGSGYLRAVCSCYTGGDFNAADPIGVVSNTSYRVNNNQCIAASMAVTTALSPLVFWAGTAASSGSFTEPSVPTSDWIEDDDAGGGTTSYSLTEICSMIWSGSGATGAMAATMSGNRVTKHAMAVALKPVAIIEFGAATMSGTGTLVGIGHRLRSAIATISGAGSLAAIPHITRGGKATLSGAGSLAAIAKGIKPGKATLSGIGAFSARAICVLIAKAQLTGAGFLIAIGRLVGINEEVSITMPDKTITPSFPDKSITISFDERTIKVR